MKCDGRWVPTIKPNTNEVDYTAWNFHIASKDKLREMINNDPEADGSLLELIKELTFDKRLARTTEDGEQPILNEIFFLKLIEDYNLKFSSYKPPVIIRLIKDKVSDFIIALYRVDSAYYERIGGIVSYIVVNKHKFSSLDSDYSSELNSIYEWWSTNERRRRTRSWIDWIFRFLIKKYNSEEFYKKSINHVLHWIALNAQNWLIDERFNPEKWFGAGRGTLQDYVYGEG